MRLTLILHIIAGSLGLLAGYVALYSTKGAALHRRAGSVFVYVMLTMTGTGLLVSAVRGVAPAINIPAALITAYLVITGMTTLRPPAAVSRGLQFGALGVALAVGLASLNFGFEAIANGGSRNGMPAFPFFLFGMIGVLGGVGDIRMLRSGGVQGRARLTRHLWRMCVALLIAAMSFFFGQADELPKAIRLPPLLALPVLAVLVTMLYWVWRVRIRRTARGMVGAGAPETA